MLRALLEGRKTQTRRIITPNNLRIYTGGLDYPGSFVKPDQTTFKAAFNNARKFRRIDHVMTWVTDPVTHQIDAVVSQWTGRSAYSAGDRLWVREAWRADQKYDDHSPSNSHNGSPVLPVGCPVTYDAELIPVLGRNRQGIHMPRWASRITLEVIDVRFNRLQEISEEDAIAEGCTQALADDIMQAEELAVYASTYILCPDARARILFETLWDQVNGPGTWEQNPWVAAYTFHVINRNIDQIEVAA